MTLATVAFCFSLLFSAAYAASTKTVSKPVQANLSNKTLVESTGNKCFNVFNYYTSGGHSKNIQTLFREVVKEQLVEFKEKIESSCENRTGETGPSKNIETLLREVKEQLVEVKQKIESSCENKTGGKVYKRNCAELYKSGETISGVYTIKPDNSSQFDVFCDQTTAGGGWTVFQKRLNGSVDFYRGWDDYKRGFGNLTGEFWLGLDKIHRLTNIGRNKLHVDLEEFQGKTAYAKYDKFAVSSEKTKYQLSLGTYSGTAGNSLSYHRGFPFTTKDRDNDGNQWNCAVQRKGAWWYNSCNNSNLNGFYHHGKHSGFDGVNWGTWKGYHYSAKRAEMKIRPADF